MRVEPLQQKNSRFARPTGIAASTPPWRNELYTDTIISLDQARSSNIDFMRPLQRARSTTPQPHLASAHSMATTQHSNMSVATRVPTIPVGPHTRSRPLHALLPHLNLLRGLSSRRFRPDPITLATRLKRHHRSKRSHLVPSSQTKQTSDHPRPGRFGRSQRPRPFLSTV